MKFLVVHCCLGWMIRDVHLAAGGGMAQVRTVASATKGSVPGNSFRHVFFNPFEQTEN